MFRRTYGYSIAIVAMALVYVIHSSRWLNSFSTIYAYKVFPRADISGLRVNAIVDVSGGQDVFCMETRPRLHGYETQLKGDFATSNGGCYCAKPNTTFTFDINYNIERSFVFGPFIQHGEKRGSLTWKGSNVSPKGIPRKFHFIWSRSVVPTVFVDSLKRFRELNPEWEIHFWTIDHGRQLLKQLEPRLLEMYNRGGSDTVRADILRYVLLYHHGGAYLDLDVEPKLPFDNLTTADDCLLGPEPLEHAFINAKRRSLLSNAIIFCKPRHPFIRFLLDRLLSQGLTGNIIAVAGPMFVTKSLNSFIAMQLNDVSMLRNGETSRISIMRHEYFESLVMKYLYPTLSERCKPLISAATYFKENCMGTTNTPVNCSDLESKHVEDKLMFDVCIEWVSHGQEKRDEFKSVRYALHVHYATREKLRSLKYMPENDITKLIPDAVVHL